MILQLSTRDTDYEPSNSPSQKFQNLYAWNSHDQDALLTVAIPYQEESMR